MRIVHIVIVVLLLHEALGFRSVLFGSCNRQNRPQVQALDEPRSQTQVTKRFLWPIRESIDRRSEGEKLIDGTPDLDTLSDKLSTTWSRYMWLRDMLDYVPPGDGDSDDRLTYMGNVTWQEVSGVFALLIGYRPTPGETPRVVYELAPPQWIDVDVPSLSDFDSTFMDYMLAKDLPDDDEENDLILETIGGLEFSKVMARYAEAGAVEVRRKLLLVKWLYVQGFLTNDFPPRERFTPHHLVEDDETDIDDYWEDEE